MQRPTGVRLRHVTWRTRSLENRAFWEKSTPWRGYGAAYKTAGINGFGTTWEEALVRDVVARGPVSRSISLLKGEYRKQEHGIDHLAIAEKRTPERGLARQSLNILFL